MIYIILFFLFSTLLYADNNEKLIEAAIHNNNEHVYRLLREGANCNQQDEYGATALTYAILYNNTHMVNNLLAFGADVNIVDKSNSNALHIASAHDNQEIMAKILPKINNINAINNLHLTALMIAGLFNHAENAKLLIHHQATINNKSIENKDILEYVVGLEHWDTLDIILSNKEYILDLNQYDYDNLLQKIYKKNNGQEILEKFQQYDFFNIKDQTHIESDSKNNTSTVNSKTNNDNITDTKNNIHEDNSRINQAEDKHDAPPTINTEIPQEHDRLQSEKSTAHQSMKDSHEKENMPNEQTTNTNRHPSQTHTSKHPFIKFMVNNYHITDKKLALLYKSPENYYLLSKNVTHVPNNKKKNGCSSQIKTIDVVNDIENNKHMISSNNSNNDQNISSAISSDNSNNDQNMSSAKENNNIVEPIQEDTHETFHLPIEDENLENNENKIADQSSSHPQANDVNEAKYYLISKNIRIKDLPNVAEKVKKELKLHSKYNRYQHLFVLSEENNEHFTLLLGNLSAAQIKRNVELLQQYEIYSTNHHLVEYIDFVKKYGSEIQKKILYSVIIIDNHQCDISMQKLLDLEKEFPSLAQLMHHEQQVKNKNYCYLTLEMIHNQEEAQNIKEILSRGFSLITINPLIVDVDYMILNNNNEEFKKILHQDIIKLQSK